MQLIAVVMGAETRDSRNEIAEKLLDHGFANYTLYSSDEKRIESIPVRFGVKDSCEIYEGEFKALVKRASASKIEKNYDFPLSLQADIKAFEPIGTVRYSLDGETIGEAYIYSKENIEKITLVKLWKKVFSGIFNSTKQTAHL